RRVPRRAAGPLATPAESYLRPPRLPPPKESAGPHPAHRFHSSLFASPIRWNPLVNCCSNLLRHNKLRPAIRAAQKLVRVRRIVASEKFSRGVEFERRAKLEIRLSNVNFIVAHLLFQ